MEAFREKWKRMHPAKKNALVVGGVVFALLMVSFLVFLLFFRSKERRVVRNPEAYTREVPMDADVVEKSLYTKTMQEIEKLRRSVREVQQLKKQIETLQKEKEELERRLSERVVEAKGSGPEGKPEGKSRVAAGGCEIPVPRPSPAMSKKPYPPPPLRKGITPFAPSGRDKERGKKSPGFIGDIGIERGAKRKEGKERAEKGKKQKGENTVYLPSGTFMKATLLTGVDAPVAFGGKNEPRPVLLRIKDLAILPNYIKSDLKGCFVTGIAEGKLNDERVHIVLERLSCIAKNGHAVIDQKVDGYVVDEDGKVGLRGDVAAPKLGTNIARAALAGFFGGLGEGIRQNAFNFESTPVGTTQLLPKTSATNITKAAIGGGISAAAEDLRKFYLQLAEQSLPVIEVGATKTVTVVIKKGVELKIKDYKTPDVKGGEEDEEDA